MYQRSLPSGTSDTARDLTGNERADVATATVYPYPMRVVRSFKIVLMSLLFLMLVLGCGLGPSRTIQTLTACVTPYFWLLVAWRAAAIIWHVTTRHGASIARPSKKADRGLSRLEPKADDMNHLIGSISLVSHLFCRKPVPTFRRDAVLSHLFCRKPVPTFRRDALSTTDGDLPLVSVLVALYRESAIVPDLVKALKGVNYPADKIEVLFLTEADDASTRKALLCAGLATHMRVLTVPDGSPRTKPRALNHGLNAVRGEFVVVFDAEDRPDPRQIRDALECFEKAGQKCICVQAPLQIHNHRDSWISEQFSLEYDVHFQILLPFLSWCRMPIPLGGTSNYFRVRTLRLIGGWDAYNVTEDAELGMRIAQNGFLTSMIHTPTLEEAPISFVAWTRQRSRWIKGHIQTLFTLWQNPLGLVRQLGFVKLASVHIILMGAIVSALLHGVFFTLGVVVLYQLVASPGLALSAGAVGVALSAIATNLVLALCVQKPGKRRWRAVSTLIFYWPLQTIATICAVLDLLSRPFYWSKTTHGLAGQSRRRVHVSQPLP